MEKHLFGAAFVASIRKPAVSRKLPYNSGAANRKPQPHLFRKCLAVHMIEAGSDHRPTGKLLTSTGMISLLVLFSLAAFLGWKFVAIVG